MLCTEMSPWWSWISRPNHNWSQLSWQGLEQRQLVLSVQITFKDWIAFWDFTKKNPVKYEIHFQDDEHTCRIPKIAGLGAGPASGASLRQDPGPGPSLRHSLRFLEWNTCQDFFPIRKVPCQRLIICQDIWKGWGQMFFVYFRRSSPAQRYHRCFHQRIRDSKDSTKSRKQLIAIITQMS